MSMSPLSGLVPFIESVECGSFVKAGRKLGISASAVGKSITRLEERMGTRLLNRSTRSMSLTKEGKVYYDYCQVAVANLQMATQAVTALGADAQREVSLSLPIALGKTVILPVICKLQQEEENTVFDIIFTDRVLNLVDEDIDIAVRIGELEDSALKYRQVGWQQLVTCISPGFKTNFGMPQHPNDLLKLPCITYRSPTSRRTFPLVYNIGKKTLKLPIKGNMTLDNGEALVYAGVQGSGVIQVPSYMVTEQIANQQLLPILDSYAPNKQPISVLHQNDPHMPVSVRKVYDHICHALQSNSV